MDRKSVRHPGHIQVVSKVWQSQGELRRKGHCYYNYYSVLVSVYLYITVSHVSLACTLCSVFLLGTCLQLTSLLKWLGLVLFVHL